MKFVYVSSLLPTPKELVKDLNRLLFQFLWKGTDKVPERKVPRVSTINDFEHGGLKMIDIDSMIVTLRLAWLKRKYAVKMVELGRPPYVTLWNTSVVYSLLTVIMI